MGCFESATLKQAIEEATGSEMGWTEPLVGLAMLVVVISGTSSVTSDSPSA